MRAGGGEGLQFAHGGGVPTGEHTTGEVRVGWKGHHSFPNVGGYILTVETIVWSRAIVRTFLAVK